MDLNPPECSLSVQQMIHDVAVAVWNNAHDQHISSDALMHSVVWEKTPEASSSDIVVVGSNMLQYEQIYIKLQRRLFGVF